MASERGERAPQIARTLGCTAQTVLNVIHTLHQTGLAVLRRHSSRPHTVPTAFDAVSAERLCALLHQSPRTLGKPTSVWTLPLAAAVSFAQGLTEQEVSGETVRATLERLGVKWQRAKRWITSPDPAYVRKKGHATA